MSFNILSLGFFFLIFYYISIFFMVGHMVLCCCFKPKSHPNYLEDVEGDDCEEDDILPPYTPPSPTSAAAIAIKNFHGSVEVEVICPSDDDEHNEHDEHHPCDNHHPNVCDDANDLAHVHAHTPLNDDNSTIINIEVLPPPPSYTEVMWMEEHDRDHHESESITINLNE